MCVTRTWVPSWSNAILIWYHYIVICTLVTIFNWWLSNIVMKLRVLIKEALLIFHWLTFRIVLVCALASGHRALFFCFWYKRQLKNYYYIYVQCTLPTVCKSAQYYCRAFISINDRRINYKYIIATDSFMCVITIFRLYNMKENCLMLHLYGR